MLLSINSVRLGVSCDVTSMHKKIGINRKQEMQLQIHVRH